MGSNKRRKLVWSTSGKEPTLNEYGVGASPQNVENVEYFLERFKEQLCSDKKMTFRASIKTLMNLMDLID